MINTTLIEENKQKLLTEKGHLEKLLSRVAKKHEATGDFHAVFPNVGDDQEDNAVEVEQYQENLSEEKDFEQKLLRVNAALERINAGTYGICKVGGEELPEERLLVVPEAENCVQHEPR